MRRADDGELGVAADDVLGWELMTHDVVPSGPVGRTGELISAPRLDNQGTCFAGLHALLASAADPADGVVPVLALFDHEEVGSMSDRGAQSDLLGTTLERIVLCAGGDRDAFLRAMAGSVCASGDMAHATHPNYADRHEPGHQPSAGGGPVLKINANLKYASDGPGQAAFVAACERAEVPHQMFVNNNALACGSTIGPITATRLGIRTVDIGMPILSMHAIRELCAAEDPPMLAAALAAFATE